MFGVTMGLVTTIALHRLFRITLQWLCPATVSVYTKASHADLRQRVATATVTQRHVIAPITEELLCHNKVAHRYRQWGHFSP